MKPKTKKFVKSLILVVAFFNLVAIAAPHQTHAAVNSILSGQICEPDNSTTGYGTNLARCVNNIYTFGIAIGGFVAVLMFVLAGYFYTMGGNENISKAKSYISSTVIGLILLFGTYALLNTINPNLTVLPTINQDNPCYKVDSDGNPVYEYKKDAKGQPVLDSNGQPTKVLVPVGLGQGNCADVGAQNPYKGGNAIPNQLIDPADKGIATSASEGDALSVNNTFSRFDQMSNQPPKDWAKVPYTTKDGKSCVPEDESTIGTSGCGPSAMAIVLKHFDDLGQLKPKAGEAPTPVDPRVIAKLSSDLGFRACGSGTAYGMFSVVASKYGLNSEIVNWSGAVKALKKHYPVIAAMGPGYFTSTGHFIVLYDLSDSKGKVDQYGDYVKISDSGPRNRVIASAKTVEAEQHFMIVIRP